MVDEVAKSLKLNRNLSNNLPKAVELDRAIKIGWGAQGDAKPKEGEIGIAAHLFGFLATLVILQLPAAKVAHSH